MLTQVFSGAAIMLIGITTGWVLCNVARKKVKEVR